MDVAALPGKFSFCGLDAASPLGIPAGPLLNGRWLVHYAQLGFDILTYKTVRSRQRACYAMPNLQPIREQRVKNGQEVWAAAEMGNSWAISFGMPSMAPEIWREDVLWTRRSLSPEKLLVVSVVATPEADWTAEQVANDYALCARWATESGADAVELNLSCPNVTSVDGQLFQNPPLAQLVMQTVRDAVGSSPLIIKIGPMLDRQEIARLLEVSQGLIQGIAMTNCLSCRVKSGDDYLFEGAARGIGGEAIRAASIAQVEVFSELIRDSATPISIIGVGGINEAQHVIAYMQAGAESVQIATAAMLKPELAIEIKQQLTKNTPHQP